MGCEVLDCVGLRPRFRISGPVGHHRGDHGNRALDPHTKMQRATALPELHPRPEFTQTQVFLRLRDGAAADTAEDEFVPDFVELVEFGVFPRSFTS